MSITRKVLLGAIATFALAAPALAQETSPWDMRESMAYVVNPQGKMMVMKIGNMKMMKGKRVPAGTAFYMSGGQLYMMTGAFDRAGNFRAGGG